MRAALPTAAVDAAAADTSSRTAGTAAATAAAAVDMVMATAAISSMLRLRRRLGILPRPGIPVSVSACLRRLLRLICRVVAMAREGMAIRVMADRTIVVIGTRRLARRSMEGIREAEVIMAGIRGRGSSTVRLRVRDRIGGMTTGMVVITGDIVTRGGIGNREQVVMLCRVGCGGFVDYICSIHTAW
jgi:hypothetical protein